MKVCSACQQQFSDDVAVCPRDGSILVEMTASAAKLASLVDHDDDWLRSKLAAGAQAAAFQSEEPVPAPPPPPAKPKVVPMQSAPAEGTDPKKNISSGLPSARSKEELERLLTPQRAKTPISPPPLTAPKPAPPQPVAEAAPPPVRRPPPPPSPLSNLPWNKIAPAAGVVVIIIGGLLFFRGGSTPAKGPTAETPDVSITTSGAQMEDVDIELGVRQALAKTNLLRNEKIDYRVKDGTLTLIGEATSEAKVQEAIRQARLLPGVKNVVDRVSIRSGREAESDTHVFKTGGLQSTDQSGGAGTGVAQQAKAHDLVLAAQRQMAKGDYKGAASLFRLALTYNPDDTEAQTGYAQATDKAQR